MANFNYDYEFLGSTISGKKRDAILSIMGAVEQLKCRVDGFIPFDLSEIQADITAVEQTIQTLVATDTATEASLSALSASLVSLTSQLQTQADAVSNLQINYSSLLDYFDVLQNLINTLSAEISNHIENHPGGEVDLTAHLADATAHGINTKVSISGTTVMQPNGVLLFPNNQNTLLQRDQFGNSQNIAYYDADGGLQVGPNDLRYQIQTNVPINIFRPQPLFDFDTNVIDPRLAFVSQNGGTFSPADNSKWKMSTGTIVNGGGKLKTSNILVPCYSGQKCYFYMETVPNGNLLLEFGFESDDLQHQIKFSRADNSAAQNYFAKSVTTTGTTTTDTGQLGNSVRRLFALELASVGGVLSVLYYASTDAGVLQLKATHQTDVPAAGTNLRPFVRFTNNGYSYNRDLLIDFVAPILLR